MKANKLQGFTLIELIVTISIIGLLSAIAMPAYQDYVAKAKAANAISHLSIFQNKVAETFTLNGELSCTHYSKAIPNCTNSGTGPKLSYEFEGITASLQAVHNSDIHLITWQCTLSGVNAVAIANCQVSD